MKDPIKKLTAVLLAAVMLVSTAACASTDVSGSAPSSSAAASVAADDDVDGKLIVDSEEKLQYATGFTLTHYKGGYIKFTVDSSKEREFLIVPEGKSVPDGLADNVVVLQQPLTKICVNSTGMMSLIDAIGGLDHISTVGTDVDGWYIDNVIAKLKSGEIKYSGNYKAPDFEMLTSEGIQLEVDTTMLVSHPDVMEKYDELGIPYFIECSSNEGHPLGRVEWVKLYGALMGLEKEADAYFDQQAAKVETVTSAEKSGKTVAMFYISSGSDKVYARNGGDYMARMIGMAGGTYIMEDVAPEETGNTSTTFEDVYSRCVDADYLFYVNFALKFNSIEEMTKYNSLFADFKAVKEGNVYVTAPSFTQSISSIAGIIEDMHAVLDDPGIKSTDSLIKLE